MVAEEEERFFVKEKGERGTVSYLFFVFARYSTALSFHWICGHAPFVSIVTAIIGTTKDIPKVTKNVSQLYVVRSIVYSFTRNIFSPLLSPPLLFHLFTSQSQLKTTHNNLTQHNNLNLLSTV